MLCFCCAQGAVGNFKDIVLCLIVIVLCNHSLAFTFGRGHGVVVYYARYQGSHVLIIEHLSFIKTHNC